MRHGRDPPSSLYLFSYLREIGQYVRTMTFLHEWSPPLRDSLPHLSLGSRPTPVSRMPRLSHDGAEIWLKDEGAFGDGGWGGNKVRKLEWLLADANRKGKKSILTFGGLGTNWGLATALYGREQGLETALALVDQPRDDHVEAQLGRLRRSGASLHYTRGKARTIAALPWLIARHSNRAGLPYVLPVGGSSPLGTLGYVEAGFEIAAQVREGILPEPSHVVVPVGSGGTSAGLLLGLRLAGLSTKVVGVVVNDKLRLDDRTTLGLAGRCAKLLRDRGATLPPVQLVPQDLIVVRDWLGPGYGHPTPEAERSRIQVAELEGLELDPVYTAKAMAALQAMNADGRFGHGPVLFINTNGAR